jgi:NAD(P)-dependent dehydrogenase (short-subunit alcohol dehydrogenase family)
MTGERGTVLVTGASAGIGLATAQKLAYGGFRVFGASRRACAAHNGVEWVRMDVTDEDSVAAGVREVLEKAGAIFGLVCSAGYGVFGSLEETSLDRARAQFDTNVFGVLRLLRAVVPGMRQRGAGRVVVVGSLAGRAPIPFQAHYSASKAAVDALTLSLRNELHGTGVAVSLVEPGDIRTEFNERMDWGEVRSSAYGDRLAKCERVIRTSLPKAPGPEIVACVIARALTSKRPRVRYCVGPDSRLVPWGRRLLPEAWCLALIRDHFQV